MSMGAPGARGVGGGPSVKESRLCETLKMTLRLICIARGDDVIH